MRKSFILHIDSLAILDKLSNEQAGVFLKAIYQFQLTGEIPNGLDFVMEIALTPFFNQFIRDEENWILKGDRLSEKGILGNLKRWHNDLYLQVVDNQLDIHEANDIAKVRKASPPDTTQSGTIPKSLVSVSKNVSVSKVKEKRDSDKLEFIEVFLSSGIKKELLDEYVSYRTSKKLVLTKRAANAILNQAKVCKWNIDDIITHCMDKNWDGFEAVWIKPETIPPSRLVSAGFQVSGVREETIRHQDKINLSY